MEFCFGYTILVFLFVERPHPAAILLFTMLIYGYWVTTVLFFFSSFDHLRLFDLIFVAGRLTAPQRDQIISGGAFNYFLFPKLFLHCNMNLT